jgi:hypothetical protein
MGEMLSGAEVLGGLLTQEVPLVLLEVAPYTVAVEAVEAVE